VHPVNSINSIKLYSLLTLFHRWWPRTRKNSTTVSSERLGQLSFHSRHWISKFRHNCNFFLWL